MKYISIIALSLTFIMVSCGKKDTENSEQNIPHQKDSQQLTQQQTTNNGQTQQQQTTNQISKDTTIKDTKKTEEKKTEENKTEANKTDANKKIDADKKNETEKNSDFKITSNNTGEPPQSDIDFASIYAKKCAKCHGKNGHGKPDGAPDLTADSTRSKSDSKLLAILKNGIKAKNPDDDDMPAWKGKLSDEELNAAIKYIKSIP